MGIRYVCQKCNRQFKSPYYLAVHKKCTPNSQSNESSTDLFEDSSSTVHMESSPVISGIDSAITMETIPVDGDSGTAHTSDTTNV